MRSFGSRHDVPSDFDPQSTRQVPPDEIASLAQQPDEYEEGMDGMDPNTMGGGYSAVDEDQLEQQLENADLGDEIDHGVAVELEDGEDMPFDPHEARAFDAAVADGEHGYEDTDLPADDGLAVSGSYDPYVTDAGDANMDGSFESTIMSAAVPDMPDTADAAPPVARAESLVEDDLDEADFYTGQGMYPEAMDALRTLLDRHPNHPLILAKMREVQAAEAGESGPADTPPGGVMPLEVAPEHSGGTDALELDEIEEVSDEELEEEVDSDGGARATAEKRKPSVMLEKPVDEGDADTHFDLGLAYKEMGLFDEAIKAFEKVARSPGREVQCRVMLGMCQREQGNPQEAIHQFKQGLHANPVDRERLSLYYEIGVTYESIGDQGEALYYFEAVTKRDPAFADAGSRAAALRSSGGHATAPVEDDL
jgi:tetratricopeptide (TPR) repeat protein